MKTTIRTIIFCIILVIKSINCQTLRCRDVVQISLEGTRTLSLQSNKNCESTSDQCFKASAVLTYRNGSLGEMNISSCIPRVQCSASTCDDFLPAASKYVNIVRGFTSNIQRRLDSVVNISSCCFGFCSTNQCNDGVTAEQLGCDPTLCTASPETITSETTTSGSTRIGVAMILYILLGLFVVICI